MLYKKLYFAYTGTMKKISIVFTLFVLHVSSVLAFSTEFLMFRGNPERNLYGMGIMPENLEIEWRYPKEPMCAKSSAYHKTKKWCGAGWTGQTLVRNYIDKNGENSQEIIFGAYDKAFHFVDSSTGKDTRKPLKTGDIIKGSATLDPDGFPLLYGGSRDNIFRIISLDEKEAKVAWSMNANNVKGLWNNDWDSNPVIRDDYLFEGGENGWLYIVKLNRAYDEKGKVTVKPKIIWKEQSYDKAFLKELKDKEVGIENSIVFYGDKFYVANSGGRILGYDISNIENRVIKRVFDFWAGDDIDGTIVIDIDGFLYVSVEEERKNKRSREIGQLIKLNPVKLAYISLYIVSLSALFILIKVLSFI